jgi:hypothetical protein
MLRADKKIGRAVLRVSQSAGAIRELPLPAMKYLIPASRSDDS